MSDDRSRYERFLAAYRQAEPPRWDTGIVPPEVRALVEGPDPLPAGRALDVGCGTGVSAVYLAGRGWRVTGVDWVAAALKQARARARAAGLGQAQIRFVRADAGAPDFLPGHPAVDLWLDIGCLHGLAEPARLRYAHHAARLVTAGGLLRLYAWRRHADKDGPPGLDPGDVAHLFAPAFDLLDVALSRDTAGEERRAAWYALRRAADPPA